MIELATMRCNAAPLGSRTVQIICQRLLLPTGRFRRQSRSLDVRPRDVCDSLAPPFSL